MQLPVDSLHLGLGRAQEALDLGGDFRLQVILEHLAFLCGEQLAALVNVVGQPPRELVGSLGTIVKEDVDNETPVAGLGTRLVAKRAQGALQLLQILRDLPLHAGPDRLIVQDMHERLLDASCKRQSGINGPWAAQVGQFDVGQRRRQQAALRKMLQACDGDCACCRALGQRSLGTFAHGAGARAGLCRKASRLGR